MRLLHRTLDRIDVPSLPLGSVTPDFRAALVTGVLALGALAVGGSLGDAHSGALHRRMTALGCAAAFLLLAGFSVRRAGSEAHRVLLPRVGPAHAGIVRLLIMVSGMAVVVLTTLGMLAVPLGQLLLGGALTGVVIGIAAQQSLGNVFAGLMLLLARPFSVGDAVRVRSGALGGELRGTVTGMGLTYVTLDTAEGLLSLPNAAVLAAGIGPDPAAGAAPTAPAPRP